MCGRCAGWLGVRAAARTSGYGRRSEHSRQANSQGGRRKYAQLQSAARPAPAAATPAKSPAAAPAKVPPRAAPADAATPKVAAPAAAGPFECRWADHPIQIDGSADEGAWQHSQRIDDFTLPWLQDKARPAKTATRARLLWDREFIYFFADMDDGDLYADVKEDDAQIWDNDVFEMFLKPADDRPAYYEFQVNAAGAKLDMLLPRRGAGGFVRFRKDGEFHIDAVVKLRGTLNDWTDTDKGWSVEGRIPWRDFVRTGGRPEAGDIWKFTLCRYDFSVDFEGPELSTCACSRQTPIPTFTSSKIMRRCASSAPRRRPATTCRTASND